ncbi:QcrA and Rieske domain-containing protein [Calditrichota bacterium LG25]
MAEEDKKINRREFFFKSGVFAALGASLALFFRNLILYIFPEKKEKTYHKYLVAHEREFKDGRPKQISLGKTPVYVVPHDGQFKVMSGICTHLGCIIKWEQDKNRFFCPCHNGIFDKLGNVIGGPPPRPLDEFKVVVEDQKIYVYVEDKVRSPWV